MYFRRTTCRRVLGYLLLLLIVYGATAQAAHSHGPVAPGHQGPSAIIDASESRTSDSGRSPHRECSMCQFQQQLFGGLVHAPLFAGTPLAVLPIVSPLTVLYPSTSTARPSGRAPPLVRS